MSKLLYLFIFIAGLMVLLVSAEQVFASTTTNYNCSNLSSSGGNSCSNGVWTYASDNTIYSDYNLAPGTWYVSYTLSGEGGTVEPYLSNGVDCSQYEGQFTGSQSDLEISDNSCSGSMALRIGSVGYRGDIYDICITDTQGGCEGGQPEPTPSVDPSVFSSGVTTQRLNQDVVVMYLFAPLLALFVYLLFKMLSHFKW